MVIIFILQIVLGIKRDDARKVYKVFNFGFGSLILLSFCKVFERKGKRDILLKDSGLVVKFF